MIMRAIGKTTEMAKDLWRDAYIQINLTTPPKVTNSTSIDVTFGDSWCSRVVARQEDFYCTALVNKWMIKDTPNHPHLRMHNAIMKAEVNSDKANNSESIQTFQNWRNFNTTATVPKCTWGKHDSTLGLIKSAAMAF